MLKSQVDPREGRLANTRYYEIKQILRESNLNTCARKPRAPTSASALAMARPRS